MRVWGLPLRGKGDSALYTFARYPVTAIFGGVYRGRAWGTENLPREGAAIVIINHQSNVDPVFVGMMLDRPLRYMAKKELFGFGPFNRLIEKLGAFPIDRGAGDRDALRRSLDILAQGEVLLMFPEGHRRRDGQVHPFLPGVGMLALRSGAAVVPMAMKGTERLVEGRRPRLPAVRAVMGPPVDLSGIEGRSSKAYQEAARRMHEAVAGLYAEL